MLLPLGKIPRNAGILHFVAARFPAQDTLAKTSSKLISCVHLLPNVFQRTQSVAANKTVHVAYLLIQRELQLFGYLSLFQREIVKAYYQTWTSTTGLSELSRLKELWLRLFLPAVIVELWNFENWVSQVFEREMKTKIRAVLLALEHRWCSISDLIHQPLKF